MVAKFYKHFILRNDFILNLILFILGIIFIGFEFGRKGDFNIYLESSRVLLNHKNIYNELYGDQKLFEYMGSPFLSFILIPFAWLPYNLAQVAWKLLNLFFLYRIWKISMSFFQTELLNKIENFRFVIISFLSVLLFIYSNFHTVQFTIFIMYSMIEGLYQTENNKPVSGALLISLSIIVKVLPVVMIPFLLYRNYTKCTGYILLFLILFVLIPAPLIGWDFNIELYQGWWRIIDPANNKNSFDVSTNSIFGISSLISTLLIEGIRNDYSLELKRNIMNIQPAIVLNIILAARLLLVIFTLWFIVTKPFKRNSNKFSEFRVFSYICLVTPLIFPQQRTYAFFLLFPSIIYLTYFFLIAKKNGLMEIKRIKYSLYVQYLIVFILNLDLILGNFREIYWHYKLISYASLLLIVQLVLCNPKVISKIYSQKSVTDSEVN